MDDKTKKQFGKAHDEAQHLRDLLKDFDTAMMLTRDPGGGLGHARPMAVGAHDDDGTLYFATDIHSAKIAEIEADSRIQLIFQGKLKFVSLLGTARVSTERAVIDRVWSEFAKTWFPKGKDDPALCAVIVEPREGEFWDQGGLKSVRYAFQQAKAYVTGTRATTGDEEQHGKAHF